MLVTNHASRFRKSSPYLLCSKIALKFIVCFFPLQGVNGFEHSNGYNSKPASSHRHSGSVFFILYLKRFYCQKVTTVVWTKEKIFSIGKSSISKFFSHGKS